jgi:hypothetical protein
MVLLEVRDIYKATACIEISHENIPVTVSFRIVVVTIIIPIFLPRRYHFVGIVGIFALDCEQFVVLW